MYHINKTAKAVQLSAAFLECFLFGRILIIKVFDLM